jgi:hypothetical protein
VEPPADPWAVSLEGGQDLMSHARASEVKVRVRWVLVSDDSAPLKKFDDLAPPDRHQRPNVEAAPGRHAAQPGESAPAHEVQHCSLHDIVRRVGQGNRGGRHLLACQFEKIVAESARSGLD